MASDSRTRAAVLGTLRQHATPPGPPPAIEGSWLGTPNTAARQQLFEEMLEAAGGRCQRVAGVAGLREALAALPVCREATRRVSLVPDVLVANVDIRELADPRELADVDFALLQGCFGVAENGAVWLDGDSLPHRSVMVLPEHLAIALPADALVDNMHAAYERLSFDGPGFGCFLSGPSKTADIEQALVIGAHGARSLSVFLIETPSGAS